VARIGDLDVHHEIAGEGPPLLFIGGTGGDLRTRPNVLDGPLVRHFTVCAYDQRGLGQTTKPDRPSTMAEYGADAAGLLDHLGWTTAAVVGVSFGGMVAQELAIARPDLVSRLVLCCTSSGGQGAASYPLHELADLPGDERRRRHLAISDTRFDDAWQAREPEAAAKQLARMAEADEATERRAAADPAAAAGARRQLEARKGHDTWDRLPSITAPTLVAAGRYDGIAPLANSEALVARIPDARLDVFEGGHLFLLQDRRAWSAILEFLGATPTPPPPTPGGA
jgi:3-oxoadipate enol-lactonase